MGDGRFKLGIRRNLFPGKVVKHWTGCPIEAVQSPSLEVFKKQLDVTLNAMV